MTASSRTTSDPQRAQNSPLVPQDADLPADRPTQGWGVHRVVGLETEYGIHSPQHPDASHSGLSLSLVNAYAQALTEAGQSVAGTEWDYGEESPLVDARGWRLPQSAAHPTQLTNQALVDDSGQPVHLLVNTLLPNGARFYVDHAHPEYSSPETTNPRDAMVWDQAGDRIIHRAALHLAERTGTEPILLYKNNTDSKSASYGAHENYLVTRHLDFDELAARLLPFFVCRQVIVGAGRVGLGISSRARPGFQISQRADFFEEQVGLETTVNRPIVNTRDEPHARSDQYRRLHVIIGDANLSQTSTWLRVGMTSLVLSMIELGTAPQLTLAHPVEALQVISHDPSLQATVDVLGRGSFTGLDLMETYLSAAEAHVERFGMTDPATTELLAAWREVTDTLRTDPASLADRLDWVAKYQLLDALRQRHGLDWDSPKLSMFDLQWADLRPEKSLVAALQRRGSLRTLVSEEQIEQAVQLPPADTRAWTRGRATALYGAHLAGVSWDSIVVQPDRNGPVHRFALRDPLAGTQQDLPEIFGLDQTPVDLDSDDSPARIRELLTHLDRYRTNAR